MGDTSVRMTVSQWAIIDGVGDRTARNWMKRVGYDKTGKLLIGVVQGKRVYITRKEWELVKSKAPRNPGIPKGYKYNPASLSSRNKGGA